MTIIPTTLEGVKTVFTDAGKAITSLFTPAVPATTAVVTATPAPVAAVPTVPTGTVVVAGQVGAAQPWYSNPLYLILALLALGALGYFAWTAFGQRRATNGQQVSRTVRHSRTMSSHRARPAAPGMNTFRRAPVAARAARPGRLY